MSATLRHDPLTGAAAAVCDFSDKPVPRIRRSYGTPTGPCPFCAMASGSPHTGDTVSDGQSTRTVLDDTATCIAVENRWSLFADNSTDPSSIVGSNEVIVSRRHVPDLECLYPDEVTSLSALLERRADLMRTRYPAVETFINVGLESGGSVTHLHGQVLGAHLQQTTCPIPADTCSCCQDIELADQNDLIIRQDQETVAYVPWAPSSNLEIRVAAARCGGDMTAVALRVHSVLQHAEKLGQHWPYNVLFHYGRHPHAHILLRVDYGVVYPRRFGVVPVSASLPRLAASLRPVPGTP